MKNIVEGLPPIDAADKKYPIRKEDKCVTYVDYLLNGQKVTSRYIGRLREDELRIFTAGEWYLKRTDSMIVVRLRYYTETSRNELNKDGRQGLIIQ